MNFYGLVWPFMVLHELLWSCMAFYGIVWPFMVSSDPLWQNMGLI